MRKLAIILVFSLFSCKSYKEIKDKDLVVSSSKSLGEFHALSNLKKKTDYQISVQELFGLKNSFRLWRLLLGVPSSACHPWAEHLH